MEELQKLYDVLVREGKYSKSFDEFQSKWSKDQAYKDKVYDVVTRDGLYGKDKDSFFQKYSAFETIKKKKILRNQTYLSHQKQILRHHLWQMVHWLRNLLRKQKKKITSQEALEMH
jgi:hypothetical protein